MTEPQYGTQEYYPGCKARLIVRFEEFGAKSTLSAEPPDTRATARRGKATEDPQGSAQAGTPQEQQSSADGLTRVVLGVIPKRASLGRNGLREADTLTLDFKYADLPLDPRCIRACAVQLYMGCVSPEDYAAGISGSTRVVEGSSGQAAAEPAHMVPDEFVDAAGNRRSNLRFEGWVDNWSVSFGEEEPTLTLECTDNTRQLLDMEAPMALTLDPAIGIADAMAKYIAASPAFRGYDVKYLPDGGEQPKLSAAMTKVAAKKGQGPAPGEKDSVWDYFIDCAGMVAHTVRMEGTTVIVQQIRELLKEEATNGRAEDPFLVQNGRELPGGERLTRRLMVYGRNLLGLDVQRTYTKQANRNVEARCYDPGMKQPLVGHWPKKGKRQTKPNPGDNADQPYMVKKVVGVRDQSTIDAIAQNTYEQLNRNEVAVTVRTKNLASYGGGWQDPDLLDLQAGDAIDIELQREGEAEGSTSTVNNLEDVLASAKQRATDYLVSLGFDDEFASTYVTAFTDQNVVSTFRVRQLGIDWDEGSGLEVEIEAVNFAVVVRCDPEATP